MDSTAVVIGNSVVQESYSVANRARLVRCTSAAMQTVAIAAAIFAAYLVAVGFNLELWMPAIFIIANAVVWVLYQFGLYILGRYVAYYAASAGVFIMIAQYGHESYVYFLVVPLALGALTLFESVAERVGHFLLAVVGAALIAAYSSISVAHPEHLQHFRLIFFLLAMWVSYDISQNFLRLNRDFRVRAHSLLLQVEQRTEQLQQEKQRVKLQAAQLCKANDDLRHHIRQGIAVERQLNSSNEQLEQFAYAASHDLKEPLRSISSFIQLIRRRLGDKIQGDLRQDFDYVVNAAGTMTRLLDDLLIYSRVGRVSPARETLELERIFQFARYSLSKEIAISEAEVSIEPSLGQALGNSVMCQSIAYHLLSNAIKFRADGVAPKIAVSAQRRGSTVTVLVRDNGIGIAAEYHEQVFQLFQRLNTPDRYTGSGIGLALARKSVELLGGSLSIVKDNRPGTCFALTLPAIQQEFNN